MRRRSAALILLLLAPAALAMRRDDLGPRKPHAHAANVRVGRRAATPAPVPTRAQAEDGTRPALRINGQVVDLATYRKTLADAETSWKWLRQQHAEDVILKDGVTKQEFLITAELAEPLAVKTRFPDQAVEHARLAQEAYERAKKGEDWNLLVDTYSTEPGAKGKHGDLGVVAFDNLVHPFNRVMFEAPIDEVQPPVQTIFGYHVGKVTEVLPPRDITRKDGSVVHRPETRRVSQILILWNVGDEATGEASDLRLELLDLPKQLSIEVLDPQLCGDLPDWCKRSTIPTDETAPPKP